MSIINSDNSFKLLIHLAWGGGGIISKPEYKLKST